MNKKLEVVYRHYALKTNRLEDYYYKEQGIKKLVHIMARAVDYPDAFKLFYDHIWIIEDLHRADFNILLDACKRNKMQGLFQVFDWINKEPLSD